MRRDGGGLGLVANEAAHLMACGDQRRRHRAADIAVCPGQKDSHAAYPRFGRREPSAIARILSFLFASCLARGIAGVALCFLLGLLGGFALLLFGCGALGRQGRFALGLCRRFGFARFAFGFIGLADFSRRTAIGGVRRARL